MLTTSAPLPVGTTIAYPLRRDAGTVQSALETIVGAGNVSVAGGPVDQRPALTITFGGSYGGQAIPDLTATNNLTGGRQPDHRRPRRRPSAGVAGTRP